MLFDFLHQKSVKTTRYLEYLAPSRSDEETLYRDLLTLEPAMNAYALA